MNDPIYMNGSNDHILKKFLRRLTPIPLLTIIIMEESDSF